MDVNGGTAKPRAATPRRRVSVVTSHYRSFRIPGRQSITRARTKCIPLNWRACGPAEVYTYIDYVVPLDIVSLFFSLSLSCLLLSPVSLFLSQLICHSDHIAATCCRQRSLVRSLAHDAMREQR